MTTAVQGNASQGGDCRCSVACAVAIELKLPHRFALGRLAADAGSHRYSQGDECGSGEASEEAGFQLGLRAQLRSDREVVTWLEK